MLEIVRLSKKYPGTEAVSQVSFSVKPGEIVGIVGPNGAGKSTLLSMIAGVVPATYGDILVDGTSIIHSTQYFRRVIGYVPQEIALFSPLSVLDNLRFWSEMAGATKKESKQRIVDIIKITGLNNVLHKKVAVLSGGMKRKLNIASALIHDPKILIMDEPTVGVDIKSKKEIINFLKELTIAGKTVVYTSHDTEEIRTLCSQVIILNNGMVRFTGSLEEAKTLASKEAKGTTDEEGPLDDILSRLGGW